MERSGNSGAQAVVLAAHGGSGASTLARALHLPEAEIPVDAQVVVVAARTTAEAADRVIHTVAALAPDQRVVLALTEDAPLPLPSAVAAMRRLLADRVAAVVVLPWQPRWRHERPTVATAHRRWTARAVDLAGGGRRPGRHPRCRSRPARSPRMSLFDLARAAADSSITLLAALPADISNPAPRPRPGVATTVNRAAGLGQVDRVRVRRRRADRVRDHDDARPAQPLPDERRRGDRAAVGDRRAVRRGPGRADGQQPVRLMRRTTAVALGAPLLAVHRRRGRAGALDGHRPRRARSPRGRGGNPPARIGPRLHRSGPGWGRDLVGRPVGRGDRGRASRCSSRPAASTARSGTGATAGPATTRPPRKGRRSRCCAGRGSCSRHPPSCGPRWSPRCSPRPPRPSRGR